MFFKFKITYYSFSGLLYNTHLVYSYFYFNKVIFIGLKNKSYIFLTAAIIGHHPPYDLRLTMCDIEQHHIPHLFYKQYTPSLSFNFLKMFILIRNLLFNNIILFLFKGCIGIINLFVMYNKIHLLYWFLGLNISKILFKEYYLPTNTPFMRLFI